MNRILVNENAARFEAAYDLLSNVVKSGLQTLVDNYLALEIGDFSIDVFNDLLKGGKKTRKASVKPGYEERLSTLSLKMRRRILLP